MNFLLFPFLVLIFVSVIYCCAILLNSFVNMTALYKSHHSNNNHGAKNTQISDECAEKSEPNDDRLANNEDACENSVDNNECDSGGSSIVNDDEQPSSSLNSSTEENRDELENHLNGTTRTQTTKLTEPAVGSDWYLYCDDNFTNVSLIEEKIYEDLCYVTFSTKPEVELNSIDPMQQIRIVVNFAP